MNKAVLGVAAAVAMAGSMAEATVIVDLQRNSGWVAADTSNPMRASTKTTGDYDGQADVADYRAHLPFSTATAFNPNAAWQSGKFYLGGVVYAYDPAAAPTWSVDNYVRNNTQDGTNDTFQIGTGNNSHVGRFAVLWRKADFLNGGDAAGTSVDITSNTAFTFNGRPVNAANQTFRWLIQKGSTYYVSQESNANPAFTGWTSSGLTTTLWAPIDLSTAFDTTVHPTLTFGSLSGGLTNLQGVGVYVTMSQTSALGGNNRIQFSGFKVDAVVPEPATLGLVASAGLLVIGRRRRAR